MKIGVGDDESSHGAGFSFGGGINLERFKLNLSYGNIMQQAVPLW